MEVEINGETNEVLACRRPGFGFVESTLFIENGILILNIPLGINLEYRT